MRYCKMQISCKDTEYTENSLQLIINDLKLYEFYTNKSILKVKR